MIEFETITHSGVLIDLLYPDPATIHLADIAHSLARTARFNGHGDVPYSVAQHSVTCAEIGRLRGRSVVEQRWLLLHDAEEAYLGDLSHPLKALLRAYDESDVFGQVTQRMRRAIRERFRVVTVPYDIEDNMAMRLEVAVNGPRSCAAHMWPTYDGPALGASYRNVWSMAIAEALFRDRARELELA